MALFNFKKKTETKSCCGSDACCTPEEAASESCCCDDGGCCTPEETEATSCCCCGDDCCTPEASAEKCVKVLGGGCKNCHKLMENTQEALKSIGMDDTVELVSDMAQIAAYGVMSTPALVVDGKVLSMGRVLTVEQAKEAIQTAR